MSPAVVPFKMNTKSFFVVLIVILISVRLLSIALSSPLQKSWLGNCINKWRNSCPIDADSSPRILRRGRNLRRNDTEGTELRVLEEV
jgi:hypothetical protein